MTKYYGTNNSILRKILGITLALLMTLMMFFVAACDVTTDPDDDDDDDDTDTETSIVLPIKNGDFKNITSTTAIEELKYPVSPKDWTQSFEGSGSDRAPNITSGEDFDAKYGIINVKSDIFTKEHNKEGLGEIANPGKPVEKDADNKDTDDNVLMLRNAKNTSQRYKSSSISIPQNSYAKISFYVYTANLADSEDTVANVKVTGLGDHELIIKNYKSKDKWTQYTIYIEGSPSLSKSIYLELGLGLGNNNNVNEHQKGYAFFDEVRLEFFSRKDFLNLEINEDQEANQLNGKGQKFVATIDEGKNLIGEVTETNNIISYSYNTNEDLANVPAFNFSKVGQGALTNYKASPTIDDRFYAKPYADAINPFGDTFSKPFSIENTTADSSIYKTPLMQVSAEKHYKVSVWMKTSKMIEGRTGAGLALIKKGATADKDVVYSFDNIDTTTSDKIKEETDRTTDANKDYKWENWVEYSFYLKASDVTTDIEFRISLGSLDYIIDNNGNLILKPSALLTKGYALFTNFNVETISQAEYSNVSASTTVKKEDFKVSTSSSVANGGFNNTSKTDIDDVNAPHPLKPLDWKGYTYNDKVVGGDGSEVVDLLNKTQSGVISQNKSYAGITNSDWAMTGVSTLPNALLINNKEASAFGYMTEKRSLSANSYARISVLVKATGTAKAYVYFIDPTTNKPLVIKIPKIDDNGQIVKDEFTTKELYFVIDKNTVSNANQEIIEYGNGWVEVAFYVATGSESKDYRIELWNGARDGSDKTTGSVYFDNVSASAPSEALFESIQKTYLKMTDIETVQYTRPSVKDDETGITTTYTEHNAFVKSAAGLFADYKDIDIPEVVEEEEEEEDKEETASSTDTQWWLFISSLILSIVLIFVGIMLFVRKVILKEGKAKKSNAQNIYDKQALKKVVSKEKVQKENDEDFEIEYKEEPKEEISEELVSNEEILKELEEIVDLSKLEDLETSEDEEKKD